MDNKKKKPDSSESKKPIKTFLIENVSASVFSREHGVNGDMRTFYSVAFSRSYMDSSNKRRYINSFNLEDLGKVIAVAQQADEYIRSLLQPEMA